MPVMKCTKDKKPGWKWGESGRCYVYTSGNEASSSRAKRKARVQGAAIRFSEERRGKGR